MIPEGWEHPVRVSTIKGVEYRDVQEYGLVNKHGDSIAKTLHGKVWKYQVKIKGGAAAFGLKSIDEALAMVGKARGNL